MVFWMRPQLPLKWYSVFSKWKVLRWYTYRECFIDIESVVLEFFSNVFVLEETVILGCFWVFFLARTPQNVVNFVWNFDQWWHVRWCIRYCMVLFEVLRNGWNWAKKLFFLALLRVFFVYVLSHPMSYVQRFCQVRGGRGKGKLGLNYHLGSHQKVIWNSQT